MTLQFLLSNDVDRALFTGRRGRFLTYKPYSRSRADRMLLRDAHFKQKRTDTRIIPKPMKLIDITASQSKRLGCKENFLERQGTICHIGFQKIKLSLFEKRYIPNFI